jgi:hypothetical protein
MSSINNGIPFVPENTIDPAAGLNLSLNTIDAILIMGAIAIQDAPPGAPADGDRYIVGSTPSGAFTGHANELARYLDGGWHFYDPANGWTVEVDGSTFVFDGSAWVSKSAPVDALDNAVSGIVSVDMGGGGEVVLTHEQSGYSLYLLSNTGAGSAVKLDPAEFWPTEAAFINFSTNIVTLGFSGGGTINLNPGESTYVSLVPLITLVRNRFELIGEGVRGVTNVTTTTYTPTRPVAGHLLQCDHASGVAVELPLDTLDYQETFPGGAKLIVCKSGAGDVTVAGEVDGSDSVVILKRAALSLTITEAGACLEFIRVAENTWRCIS